MPVTDPAVIEEFKRRKAARQQSQTIVPTTSTQPGGTTDPAIVQEFQKRKQLRAGAAKKKASILKTGADMPDLGTSSPATLQDIEATERNEEAAAEAQRLEQIRLRESPRTTQAFEAASDPRANQPFPLPARSEYGFQENTTSRLPFGDEVMALGGGINRYIAGKSGQAPEKSFSDAWNYGQAINRAAQEKYRSEHPWRDVGGSLLGIAATGAPTGGAAAFGTLRQTPAAITAARTGAKPATAFFNPAAQEARAVPATVAGRAGEGIAQGAPLGALYGAGEGEGWKERAINAATGAAVGTGVGATLPYLGAAARSTRRLRNAYEPEIGGHVKRLDQEADALYKKMDATGVEITPLAFQRMAGNVRAKALAEGINPRAHPKAVDLLEGLTDEASGKGGPYLNQKPTFRRMDQIRRDLRDSGTDPTDKRMLRVMMEGWDEQMNRLTPRDLARGRGTPREALDYLKEGRRIKKQFYKAETVDNLIENAKDKLGANYTQAGLQTGIRQEFRALNKKIRTNKMEKGRWSNEERRLINLIVRGGKGENIGRFLGMLALRGKGGASAYATATGAGSYALGPAAVPIAIGSAATGEIAKRISTARGTMNAEALDRLIGTGSSKAQPRQLGPVSRGIGQARRYVVQGAGGLGDRLLTGD
jgi:hypothetical protein